ncbi:hypothetical protein [Bdellovibrio sp. HCB2-146]|uniref:hypothetical protein n=1 Tax=Bdellovibrio sp. HCB2-146 TaxID=3394362 RepID=UPI0039BCC660
MSNHSEGTLLQFPFQGPEPTSDVVIIRDIEVAGVGALRRRQLENLSQNKKIILWTYEDLIPEDVKSIYEGELLRTLQSLRPFKTEAGPMIDLEQEHKRMFVSLFPLTNRFLGLAANKIRDEYIREMNWSSWLLQDHWRYFSGFLRQKFPQNREIQEVGQWEWIQAWLETQAFETTGLGDSGTVVVNPSLQYVNLENAVPALNRDAGLYAFIYSETKNRIVESKLDAHDAEAIDFLNEDRKFTQDQLIEMLVTNSENRQSLTREEWKNKVAALIQRDFILPIP